MRTTWKLTGHRRVETSTGAIRIGYREDNVFRESPPMSAPDFDSRSIQRYARVTGLLILVSIIAGGFGEAYAPSRLIVSGDAAATAANIRSSAFLLRAGFAAYWVEASCDVTLAVLFYVLLRPVNRNLALLSAFFGMAATLTYAFAESFYFAPAVMLSDAAYLRAFTREQLDALALLSMKLFNTISAIFIGFYGLGTIIRGYLVYRSGYLPRVLGALFMIGGAGFVLSNWLFVLAPAYATRYLLLLMAPAGIIMLLWLLVKGVDVERWRARTLAR